MPPRPRTPSDVNPRTAASRSWRASLKLGKEAQIFLGFVDAPDRATAKAAAVKAWNLDGDQHNQLVVQERD
jgi:hypothetical protein